MQCIILAGGLGTRISSHNSVVPKTLIEVSGQPFAGWQLEWLANEGITSVIYLVGHKGDQVAAYVGDGSGWGLKVHYVFDGPKLLGTGGALRNAMSQDLVEDIFFLLYGDSYLNVRLSSVKDRFTSDPRDSLMCIFQNKNEWGESNVIFDGNSVIKYEKKTDKTSEDFSWIDYGLSIFTKNMIIDRLSLGEASELSDLMTELSGEGNLAGYEVNERFYEIGSVEGLLELSRFLEGRKSLHSKGGSRFGLTTKPQLPSDKE